MVLRTRVTLRGLWVIPGETVPPEWAGRIIPWVRVGPNRRLLDERARPVRRGWGGRGVVTLCIDGSPVERLAGNRARRRALRRCWADPGFSLTLDVPRRASLIRGRLAFFVLSVAACAVIGYGLLHVSSELAVLGSTRRMGAMVSFAALAILFMWCLWPLLFGARWTARLVDAREVTITPAELRVRLADGRESAWPWSRVCLGPSLEGVEVELRDSGERVVLPRSATPLLRMRPNNLISVDTPGRAGAPGRWAVVGGLCVVAYIGAAYAAAPDLSAGQLAMIGATLGAMLPCMIGVAALWHRAMLRRAQRRRREARPAKQAGGEVAA